MANYRRNFLAGGSYFFTVNLADRRLTLLNDHIDLLRAAFRQVRTRHPFSIEAAVILPDHLHASGPSRSKTGISRCIGA
jgi:putative transposase